MVLIKGADAKKLMNLVNHNEEATVVIEAKVEPKWVSRTSSDVQMKRNLEEASVWVRLTHVSPFALQPHYDVSILLTIVLVILTIVLIFAFRYKCKSNRTWVS